MISIVGFKEILKTIYTIANPYLLKEDSEKVSIPILKKGIVNFLKDYHIDIDFLFADHYPTIINSGKIHDEVLKIMDIDPKDIIISDLINEKMVLIKYSEAINHLKLLNNYFVLYDLIVNTVVLSKNVKQPGSASTPKALSLIWIQPDEYWTKFDYLESVVHEMTHILLGYDEILTPHYRDNKEIMNKDTWVPSAIRNENRPVNGVVHSILVCNELVNLRHLLNYDSNQLTLNKSTQKLINDSLKSINGLKNNKYAWSILTERMKNMIENVSISLKSFKNKEIIHE